MRRPLCVHAGDQTDSRGPLGKLRACALGLHGGLVHRAGECQTCASYEPSRPEPAPRPAKAKARASAGKECRFRGELLTGPEREAAGLSHAREWVKCEQPEQPLGPNVCSCRGCGPKCRGFEVEPENEKTPGEASASPGVR